MVRTLRNSRDRLFESVQKILSRIQKRNLETKFSIEGIKIARGLALVFGAGVLGVFSHHASERSAIREWRSTHWESKLAWTSILKERGLTLQKKIEEHTDLLKSLPGAWSDETVLWASSDACVIYLPKSPYEEGPELWTCLEHPKITRWVRLGTGLNATEALIRLFESTKMPVIAHKKAILIDPKELRY